MEQNNDLSHQRTECSEKGAEVFSYLLGKALRYDNNEKFLEVYDSLPRSYTDKLVQDIKEQARIISELCEDEFDNLSQRLNSQPENKDIHISPAMSDSERNGRFTSHPESRESSPGSSSPSASAKEVSDIMNNNTDTQYSAEKLPNKEDEIINKSFACAKLETVCNLPTTGADVHARKESQSSGVYESCDENTSTTAANVQKPPKTKKKKKKSKGKKQGGASLDLRQSEKEVDGTMNNANDDSSSMPSSMSNMSEIDDKNVQSPVTNTVSPSSIHISAIVAATENISNISNQHNDLNSPNNQQMSSYNLNIKVSSDEVVPEIVLPSQEGISASPENLQEGAFAFDDSEQFHNAEEFQQVKTRNRSRITQPAKDNSNQRKSAAAKAKGGSALRNGIISPVSSVASSTSSSNVQNSSQAIPSNGATSTSEPDHFSYANRLKNTLHPNSVPKPNSSVQINSSTDCVKPKTSAVDSKKSNGASGAALTKDSLKRPKSVADNEITSLTNGNSLGNAEYCDTIAPSKVTARSSTSPNKVKDSPIKSGMKSEKISKLKVGSSNLSKSKETLNGSEVNHDMSLKFDQYEANNLRANNVSNSDYLPSCSNEANHVDAISNESRNEKPQVELKQSYSFDSTSKISSVNTQSKIQQNPSHSSKPESSCNASRSNRLSQPLAEPSTRNLQQNKDKAVSANFEVKQSDTIPKMPSLNPIHQNATAEKVAQQKGHRVLLESSGTVNAKPGFSLGRNGGNERASKITQLQFGELDIKKVDAVKLGDFDLFEATALLAKSWEAWNSRETTDKEWFKLPQSETASSDGGPTSPESSNHQ